MVRGMAGLQRKQSLTTARGLLKARRGSTWDAVEDFLLHFMAVVAWSGSWCLDVVGDWARHRDSYGFGCGYGMTSYGYGCGEYSGLWLWHGTDCGEDGT